MKNLFLNIFIAFFFTSAYSQNTPLAEAKYTAKNKGKIFIFWGGNRDSFTKSDIHFRGADYDFTLYDVTARDKPKGWHLDYINPKRMTIPQTNFRMGYYINNHYNISIGLDHMKYVMFQDRAVNIDGDYPNQGSYNEVLPDNQVLLTEDFLTFEHTDGLNYIHTEIARVDDLSKTLGLPNTDKFQVNITEGIGGGILYPKTNAKVLSKERHDDFNISGYGLSAKVGLNFTFYKHFFIETAIKGGYINMSDIRTTNDARDSASQNFLFLERMIVFGGIFRI